MNKQKGKPMPDIHFRLRSFFFRIRDLFINPGRELEKLGLKEGQTVLDFGCGPGSYAIPAAQMVGPWGKVYALDIHPLAVRSVEKKAKKEGLINITTVLSDKDTGLQDQSIDVALAYDMIHMVKDKRALAKGLYRVLKPNGLLSVIAEHVKVEDVLRILETDGLFSLGYRRGNLLNLKRTG